MDLLPKDCIFEICKYLSVVDFSSLIKTDRRNYALSTNSELWIIYIKHDLKIVRNDYSNYFANAKLYSLFNVKPLLIFDNLGCAYVFQRGSHKGAKCANRPMRGYRYCKGCLQKAGVKKRSMSEYRAIPDSKCVEVDIKNRSGKFLLTEDDLILEEFPDKLYIVGKLVSGKIEVLNEQEKFNALSLGLRFNNI